MYILVRADVLPVQLGVEALWRISLKTELGHVGVGRGGDFGGGSLLFGTGRCRMVLGSRGVIW
jgi:hypothetical protein